MICALRLLAVLRLGWSGLSASIEDFAIRIFNSWKLGSRDQDNGVLIVVAPQEHRVRIEFGYGLEDTLTDVAAERIIRNLMTPRLREGNYDVGVEAGATAVIQILERRQPSAESAEWAAPPKPASGFGVAPAPMPLGQRILISPFVFGFIGLCTFIGIVTPGGDGLVSVRLSDPVLVPVSDGDLRQPRRTFHYWHVRRALSDRQDPGRAHALVAQGAGGSLAVKLLHRYARHVVAKLRSSAPRH